MNNDTSEALRLNDSGVQSHPLHGKSVGVRTQLIALFVVLSATAALQSSVFTIRHFGFGEFVSVPRDYPWMTPLAYLPFFLALWATLLALSPMLRSLRRPAVQLGVYAFFGLMCVGVLFPTVATWSRTLLCAGVSVQLARWAATRQTAQWFSRRLGLVAVGLLVLQVAGAVVMWQTGERKRAQLSSPRVAAPDGAPNVIVLILDTVRAMSMSVYGYERLTTSNLTEIAKEGVAFESAFSTAPWTLPSHGSVFTGRVASALETDFKIPLQSNVDVLAAAFHDRGYATGAFVANLHYTGWDSGLGRGFESFVDYKRTPRQFLYLALVLQTEWARDLIRALQERSPSLLIKSLFNFRFYNSERFLHFDRKWAESINEGFLEWSAQRSDRPYFAFLNYYDAHSAYDPPPPYAEKYDSAGVNRKLDRYEGGIEYLDHRLGELFDELRRRGTLDNTIVIVAGDHGDHFGEKNKWEHGSGVYAPVMRVPLIIRYPAKIAAGVRIAAPVSIADIPATLQELLPLRDTPWPGKSLVPLWEGRQLRRSDPVLLEHMPGSRSPRPNSGTARGLVFDSLYLVQTTGKPPELYRLADWRHLNDLANDPAMADTVRWFGRELERVVTSQCSTPPTC